MQLVGNKFVYTLHRCQDSSVGIATCYGLDGPGIESRWGRGFPHPSRPALGPTQPPIAATVCSFCYSFYFFFLKCVDILLLNSHIFQQHLPAQVHLPPFWNGRIYSQPTATQPMEVVIWLRRSLTVKTWVRSHASQRGICVRLMGTGKGFPMECFYFTLQVQLHRLSVMIHSSATDVYTPSYWQCR